VAENRPHQDFPAQIAGSAAQRTAISGAGKTRVPRSTTSNPVRPGQSAPAGAEHRGTEIRSFQVDEPAGPDARADRTKEGSGIGHVFEEVDGGDQGKIGESRGRLLDGGPLRLDALLPGHRCGAPGNVDAHRDDAEFLLRDSGGAGRE
jgi:hypothetical protein